ncbi:MAG: acyloxyacyl hydrolase [Prevotella sp.]|nr:acyloxyacyl hydrolase [Prevotella sp.]
MRNGHLIISLMMLLWPACGWAAAEGSDTLAATGERVEAAALRATDTGALPTVTGVRGNDTLTVRPGSHWGAAFRMMPGRVIPLDSYSSQWIHGKRTFTLGAELNYNTLPSDSDAYAAAFGYPTLSVGAAYDFNHGVTLHRYPSPSWGKAQEVDYMSGLGNALSVYFSVSRPFVRAGRLQLAYVLRLGLGFYTYYYNNRDNIDNELIGSPINIYFGAALTASWQLTPRWALMGGVEYRHHSNGALARPNKGENAVGPVVGVVWLPEREPHSGGHTVKNGSGGLHDDFRKTWFVDLGVGVGGKTLLEDWQITQFRTDPGDPDYRTEHFHFHPAYSLQTAFMYRYIRKWATGIGADLFYGSYYKRIREIETANGHADDARRVSPWSVGIALKHEVYYHRFSVAMSVGAYLYRNMGSSAKEIEKPYYERIGLRYSFASLGGMYLGASVNAHLTKADFAELVVGFPIRVY